MLSVLPTTNQTKTNRRSTQGKKKSSHPTNLTQSCDPKYIACVICGKKKFQKKQFLRIAEDEFLNALKALELLFEHTLLSGVRLQLGFSGSSISL